MTFRLPSINASGRGNNIAGNDLFGLSTNASSSMLADILDRLDKGQRMLSEKVDLQLQLLDEIRQFNNNQKQSVTTDIIAGPDVIAVPPVPCLPMSKTQIFEEEKASKSKKAKDLKAFQGALGWQKTIDDIFTVEPKADIVTRVASGPFWQFFCLFLIVVSTVIIGIETEFSTTHEVALALSKEGTVPPPSEFNDSLFRSIERGFLGWMIFEVLVNAWAQKRKFVYGPEWRWNAFDVTIVVISLITLALEAMSFSFLRVTRIGRLFRMGKILRIFRVVRFMRAIRSMLISISGSVLHLFSAMTVMCLFMFVTSLVLMQGVSADISELPPEPPSGARVLPAMFDNDDEQSTIQQIHTLYGSLLRSMMTLFLTISGGLEWSKAAGPLVKLNTGTLYGIIWTAYIAFMVFGMLNVLTGIFVEQAMNAMANDKDNMIQSQLDERDSLIRTIEKVFKDSDTDGSGEVTEQEMDLLLDDPELIAYLNAIGIDHSEAKGLFTLLDDDASGSVSIEEFVTGFMRLKGGAKAVDMVTLMYENRKIFKKMNKVIQEVQILSKGVSVLQREVGKHQLLSV